MPLDEKQKEELKRRYKEHRQSIWLGKHSRKLKNRKKDERDVDNVVGNDAEEEELKTRISPEQPTKSVEIENVISVKKPKRHRSPKLTAHEEQNQMVILRRTKEKKSVSEAPTEIIPSVSERTTLYEPQSTPKAEVNVSTANKKTTVLDGSVPKSKSSSPSNVGELSTKLEAVPKSPSPSERMLKERIKSHRQEIWSGVSSQKRGRRKVKERNVRNPEESSGLISEQNSPERQQGLTLGAVFIGIAAVVGAVVLGVLLGYLLV